MVIPGTERVLLKVIKAEQKEAKVILPGNLKAGENLFYGEIVHPGDTKFKKGQKVYYSEYSVAALYDFSKFQTLGEAMREENILFVVAADDIMAYEDNVEEKTTVYDPNQVSTAS